MALTFYVYICFKTDGTPYYVGKGSGNRLKTTFKDKHNPFKTRTAKKVGKEIVIKIAEFETEAEAFACELDLILKLGRRPFGPLTNLTDGGGGIVGLRHTPETKQKISKAGIGRKHSQESRLAISIGQKKREGSIWSRMNEEQQRVTRQKISQTHLGQHQSNEHKQKIGASLRESLAFKLYQARPKSALQRQRVSESNKTRVLSEETRRRKSEANRRRKISPETRAKQAASMKKCFLEHPEVFRNFRFQKEHATPEYRAKMSIVLLARHHHHSDETIAKMSAARKLFYKNRLEPVRHSEEAKAKMLAAWAKRKLSIRKEMN